MLTSKMSILDIIDSYPDSQQVFHSYDNQLGICVLCECLFVSLEDFARSYNICLEKLMEELESLISN